MSCRCRSPHSLRLRSLPIDSSAQQPTTPHGAPAPTAIPTQSLSPYPTTPCSLDSHQQHPAQTLVFQQTTDAVSGSPTGMTRRRTESCISAAALVTRMRNLGIIGETAVQNIFHGLGRTWRTEEPCPLDWTEELRRFHRLCFRALAEDIVSKSKTAELLKIPVREIEHAIVGSVY